MAGISERDFDESFDDHSRLSRLTIRLVGTGRCPVHRLGRFCRGR